MFGDKYISDMEMPPTKRTKLNPIGEDAYLLPDGTVVLDEDKIVFLQRRWLHKAYSPPSGSMYVKLASSWSSGQTE